jgi:hypothetical protein
MNAVLSVATNAVWVLGLSVLLAALSSAHWLASREEAGIRAALGLACAAPGALARR